MDRQTCHVLVSGKVDCACLGYHGQATVRLRMEELQSEVESDDLTMMLKLLHAAGRTSPYLSVVAAFLPLVVVDSVAAADIAADIAVDAGTDGRRWYSLTLLV